MSRYTDAMDEQCIPHNLHLFIDTTNAPNSEVFKSISSVCERLHADVLVMAANKKVRLARESLPVIRLIVLALLVLTA